MERYLDILPIAQQLAAWQQTNLISNYTQLATGRGDEPHLLHSRRVLTHYSLKIPPATLCSVRQHVASLEAYPTIQVDCFVPLKSTAMGRNSVQVGKRLGESPACGVEY